MARIPHGDSDRPRHDEQLLTGEYKHYMHKQLASFSSEVKHWPVVLFENGVRKVTVYAHCDITTFNPDWPFSVVSRTQVPLALGWAVSTERSKGMKFDRAVVDMGGDFEYGESYEAMSRVKTLSRLVVKDLSKGRGCKADPAVRRFMAATFPDPNLPTAKLAAAAANGRVKLERE